MNVKSGVTGLSVCALHPAASSLEYNVCELSFSFFCPAVMKHHDGDGTPNQSKPPSPHPPKKKKSQMAKANPDRCTTLDTTSVALH